MTLHPHRLTHAHAVLAAWVIMALIIVVEACVACHFYLDQRDVAATVIVVTSWAKDGIKSLIEKFLE